MRQAGTQHRESRAEKSRLTESAGTAVSNHSLGSCAHLNLRQEAATEMRELLDVNLDSEPYVDVDHLIVEASCDNVLSRPWPRRRRHRWILYRSIY